MIILGIDPGARYTGVVVRSGDEVLFSATYTRPVDMPQIAWSIKLRERIQQDVLDNYDIAMIGIEGINDPRSHINGKKALNNPKDIIRLAMVVGVLSSYLHPKYDVYIVPPGGNGSKSNEFYPAELKNRRPTELPGTTEAKVRDHEKSAYDVAGSTEFIKNDGFVLDSRPEL